MFLCLSRVDYLNAVDDVMNICFHSVESTALHLIMGLGSWEVQPQLSRIIMEPKSVVLISNDSEELNRAMILTLARAVHVTGIVVVLTY